MPEPIPVLTGPCAGKPFEHHHDVRSSADVAGLAGMCLLPVPLADRWVCVTCGDSGNYSKAYEHMWQRLKGALVTLDRLESQLLHCGAVVLMPSDAPAKRIGAFFGYSVYRVPGIDKIMVAIPAEPGLEVGDAVRVEGR